MNVRFSLRQKLIENKLINSIFNRTAKKGNVIVFKRGLLAIFGEKA